uniref:Neur_chan_LBD domain-containing protein n=1 Tax=Heterorhabditis bacteriophora TaxID=37862 RepID=A0A1I7WV48_HETBA
MWEDERLKWDAEQWGIEQFYVRENHQIWFPNINYSNCINLCDSKLTKIEVFNYGQVYALFEITYVAYCFVNYRRFKMGTIKMALRIPITIATLIMLVSYSYFLTKFISVNNFNHSNLLKSPNFL